MRCNHCKSKLQAIRNDFNKRDMCKTCWSLYAHPVYTLFSCRKNIYEMVEGKWKKVKICEKISNKFSFWKTI